MTILARLSALILAVLTLVPLAPSRADAYQVDCAILLCLAGGWPSSPECSRARVVFIRRITPWPVEPPLQVWRCPMGAAFQVQPGKSPAQRLYDIAFQNPPSQSLPLTDGGNPPKPLAAVLRQFEDGNLPPGAFLELAQQYSSSNGTADIDISGREFDFVRSIKVWDVQHYSHRELGKTGDCLEQSSMRLSAPTAVRASSAGPQRMRALRPPG